MSALRKFFAGPVQTLVCPHCGARLHVSSVEGWVSFVPLPIALVLAWPFDTPFTLIVWFGALAASLALYMWWAPLRPRT